MPNRVEMTGRRCGMLTALREDGRINGKVAWRCRCDCGAETTVDGVSLRTGNTRSCGCRARFRHGYSRADRRHPLYWTWKSMRQRCSNPRNDGYALYGGRGINVCDRWSRSFPAFLEDVGERPSPGMSIDRIDPNGNYEPSNVRWATAAEQQHNRRDSRRGN